ncbi:MAG: AbgT family transporter [Candidatus Latescibacteria bacterium]|nr:AbgT family transporter [Candidatus Latescibacterota bacterium]NIM21465.1 AbgT family transporter [Candidatus Latescibacterota bacterium]NIM65636.1 AbgT family transporter [Candidatus Latescibacterota bacterium]NIO02018.1 AbgT family transporter [Candidatus Latescibacterota bacterium]NIO28830.1 AbgT family transporter [Candidatus Latescibacterota bacterium]
MEKFFRFIERVGNKLPHPLILFVYLCVIILTFSFITGLLKWSAVNPKSGELIVASNLISAQGFQDFMEKMITNFTHFAPLGLVLVMLMGVAITERSGFLEALIRSVIGRVPSWLVIPVIVMAGACGNIGSDAGIVVVPPIAAIIFKRMGKHPLAGLVLGYAAATAGFTANLIPAGTDVLLAAITTEIYGSFEPGAEVVATCNWYFMIAATFVLAFVGTFVAKKYTIPMCERYKLTGMEETTEKALTPREKKGLLWAIIAGIIYLAVISLTIVPENGILRHPDAAQFMRSPFFKSLIPILFFLFVIVGYVYGKIVGTIKKSGDAAHFMIDGVRDLAPYIALVFMIAQFIAFFNWSHLDQIISIKGAELLKSSGFSGIPLFISFIIIAMFLNLFIGSGSAKWAIMAPVFVPMFYHIDLTPAFTQLLYRIGDSITNGISPLYTMFPLILGWVQQYDEDAGIGTVSSLLLPYAIFTFVAWTILLIIWYAIGLPIGVGESI